MSWLHRDDGYELFCNRDERRTRPIALGPEIATVDGVRFIAPKDTEAGGTWIAANEHGISFCLLNGQLREQPQSCLRYESRGLVLHGLLSARSLPEACDRACSFDPFRFAPFTVLILEVGHHASVIEWNGQEKTVDFQRRAMPSTNLLVI